MMPEPSEALVKPVAAATKLAPLTLPSPEELGLATTVKGIVLPPPEEMGVAPTPKAVPARIDWNATRERLDRLGHIGSESIQLSDGRYRVAFVLRTNQPNRVQHIEATAATEAEAVAVALARAEQWVATGK
jgi:hypothetical protein